MPCISWPQVERSSQLKGTAALREPARTLCPAEFSRATTRRPVLPVAPRMRAVMWVLVLFMDCMQSWISETFHSSNAQIHTRTSTIGAMDPLASLLDGPRANDAFLMRSLFEPPWSLRRRDEAPMTVVTVVRGGAWAVSDDRAPAKLRE